MKNKEKLAIANRTIHDQMETIRALNDELKMKENQLRLTERELQAKERLIIEFKDWIYTLIQGLD
ncbi:MAG: hypothetical protein U9O83_01175 [Campylobacterota bacterium]|nr:hypothetical protein [Campylobacterota bacterium]